MEILEFNTHTTYRLSKLNFVRLVTMSLTLLTGIHWVMYKIRYISGENRNGSTISCTGSIELALGHGSFSIFEIRYKEYNHVVVLVISP